MKNLRQIIKETNTTMGFRGFGNYSGDPSADDDSRNSHIDRVLQGAEDHYNSIKSYVDFHNDLHSQDDSEEDNTEKPGNRSSVLDDAQMDIKTGGRNIRVKTKGLSDDKDAIIMEAQDNEPDEVTKAREAYEHHTNEIHRLGKSMGDVRNVKIQAQIDDHQKKANEAQRVFRTFDKEQARNKGEAERAAGKRFDEDAPANAAGGGQIAGLGTTSAGKPANFAEPGVPPKNKYKKENEQESPVMGDILRRPMLARLTENTGMFAGHMTHKVPRNVFNRIMQEKAKGKHWRKYLGEHDSTIGIREYANRNPHKPVIIEDEDTGYMCYARYGKSKPGK